MEEIFKYIDTNIFLNIIIFLLIILNIINTIKLSKLRKKYEKFMKKLGNGNNIEEILSKYINTVENVEIENQHLKNYCNKLDKDMAKCLQKIGIVRYNAFKDTGSDLSFTLALLDEENNGIVLNGIYSREMSNIYAKPVENGKSPNTLSEQEKEAINKAINK